MSLVYCLGHIVQMGRNLKDALFPKNGCLNFVYNVLLISQVKYQSNQSAQF